MIKKIVFPCSMPGSLKAPFSIYFGRSEAFTMVTQDNGNITEVEVIQNFSNVTRGGSGVLSANTVKDLKPTSVVVGKVGPNAFDVLKSEEYSIYEIGIHESITVKQALDMFNTGELNILEKANAVPHHD